MDRPRLRSNTVNSPSISPTVSSSSVSRYSPVHHRTQPPKSQIPSLPRRLLVPTSCSKRVVQCPQLRPVKSKTSSNRLTRSRADSAPPDFVQAEVRDQRRWFNCNSRFEVVEEDVKIAGYQIFAVEKWCVRGYAQLPTCSDGHALLGSSSEGEQLFYLRYTLATPKMSYVLNIKCARPLRAERNSDYSNSTRTFMLSIKWRSASGMGEGYT